MDRWRPDAFHLIDWMADCHDFADTAALIMNMDLVIGVDTAVASSGGGLGQAVLAPEPIQQLLALARRTRRQSVVSRHAPPFLAENWGLGRGRHARARRPGRKGLEALRLLQKGEYAGDEE